MLARSLLAGLRRCAASSVAAAGAAVPAAPAGGAVPVAHSAGTALRSLASLCMHSSGGVGGSLASSSLASSTSGGGALSSSSSQALAAARGLLSRWGGVQQLQQLRGRTTSAHLTRKLRFKGGKMKTYRCEWRWRGVGALAISKRGSLSVPGLNAPMRSPASAWPCLLQLHESLSAPL